MVYDEVHSAQKLLRRQAKAALVATRKAEAALTLLSQALLQPKAPETTIRLFSGVESHIQRSMLAVEDLDAVRELTRRFATQENSNA